MSVDLSLVRIKSLYAFIQPYTRPTIHIAGTNGKGSVSALTSSILTAAGLRVGRFNSPHLVSIYDCIYVDNEETSQKEYTAVRNDVERIARNNLIERAKVDVVVLEVGMGGRLDATNVITDEVVMVSALTAVDLDHQAFLGETVEEITKEKSSIARRGKPFVLGPQKHPEVAEVAKMVIREAGGDFFSASPALRLPEDDQMHTELYLSQFQPPSPYPIELDLSCFQARVNALLPLYGSHQLDNVGLSASIISVAVNHPSCSSLGLRDRVTPEVISRGIVNVSWPGRLSFHSISSDLHNPSSPKFLVLADGAHNPASSTTLSRYLTDYCNSSVAPNTTITITYILSLSHSPPKTPLQTLSPLLPPSLYPNITVKVRVAVLRFTPPEGMPWVKSVPPSVLQSVVQGLCPEAELWKGGDDTTDELPTALQWAASSSEPHLVVIAGSLYLVADFYRILREL